MKEWLELNITINGFQYAVREEVNNLKDIELKGVQLSFRLHELINKRETIPVSNKCKIKPGAEYCLDDSFFERNKHIFFTGRKRSCFYFSRSNRF